MNIRYDIFARGLHWLMAVLIFGLLVLGLYMEGLPLSPAKLQLFSWHKWAGVTVFLLLLIRLAWRVTHPPPAFASTLSKQAQTLAHAGHLALYGLMFAVPLSGWLMSSAKGFQTVWFGVLPIPDLVGRDQQLGDLLQQLHWALNMALIALLAGHVAAALWHHLILKDGTLGRMTGERT
jgi:cytochrome b561